MPEAKKINHALEHGTIYFLKKNYGIKRGIGGSALVDGFRIYGNIKSTSDVKQAFEQLKVHLKEGKSTASISNLCGSFIPIAQGLGIILLTFTFALFLIHDFDIITVHYIILGNALAYFILKYPVARYFQRTLALSFNFCEPMIESVSKTGKKGVFEHAPVYLIKTKFV